MRGGGYVLSALYHRRPPPPALKRARGVRWLKADLTRREDVERALRGQDVVLQAAATTSGAKDILTTPTIHVTDNAVMNALLFRAAHERGVGHVVFFSCTVMYPQLSRPVREEDFDGRITDNYFASGWTKAYNEKMAEFYSRLGRTKYTVVRHSNVYGPHDKYDLERSHVTGATITKVMTATGGAITVWGNGSEARDLLYVDDLVDFVGLALRRQKDPFTLVNVGLGRSVSVRKLVETAIAVSGRKLRLEFDRSKPTIAFSLALDCSRAKELFGWRPKTFLERGLRKTVAWYRIAHSAGGRARGGPTQTHQRKAS